MLTLTCAATALVLPNAARPNAAPAQLARRAAVSMAETVSMDPAVLDKYMSLPIKDKVQAEYLWVDAVGTVRSKCRTVDARKASLEQLPSWNYDGSSTDQAPGDDSEVIIKPRAVFKDPFRPGNNILVLTDTYTPGGSPLPTNSRAPAADIFANGGDDAKAAWYGLEQEYTLFNMDKVTPLGWPVGGYPGPQGPYYCGAGADVSYGRAISEAHYKACLYAGLAISGTNAEVMPGQWEYQIGPAVGIDAADQLMVSRYILQRVCEDCAQAGPQTPALALLPRPRGLCRPEARSLPSLRPTPLFDRPLPLTGPHSRRLLHARPEADRWRLERRGHAHKLLDGEDAQGGRLRRDRAGHPPPRRQAPGAHRRVRRGQRAAAHRQVRDC